MTVDHGVGVAEIRQIPEIRKDALIANEEEFYRTANKLGNKILLEEKINRSIGNEWFRTKISTTLKEKTGFDVDAALKHIEEDKEDTQTTILKTSERRVKPEEKAAPAGRRTEAPKYNVVSTTENK